jgi:phosphatidylglycerophosphatase A
MCMKKIFKNVATLGPIGSLPASGTAASLIIALSLFLMQSVYKKFSFNGLLFIAIVSFLLAILIIHFSLPFFSSVDPETIVIDEVVGVLVTFVGIALSIKSVVIGFVLFRFFDIFKPWPLKKIEKLPGAFGVVLDDVVAGIFSNILLRLFLIFIC